jgi:hypothetical protein
MTVHRKYPDRRGWRRSLAQTSARLACLALVAAAAPTTRQDPAPELTRIGIAFLQKERLQSRTVVKIDPRVFSRGSGIVPTLDAAAPRHDSTVLAAANISGVSEVVTAERAQQCGAMAPLDCMSSGVSMVIALGRPVIRNDSAMIDVLIRGSEHVSEADSIAAMQRPAGRMSIRMRRAFATVGFLISIRANGSWVVRLFRPTAAT